ncbi:hypothetical protein PIB30_076349 [Stylosanthes scabra]|uniref:Uncharacterized protein n=1 Tax=Stylosanthes scabra TaxID=79078 RepID=A0ABU6WNK2_9FABA|nr:hypothetical protein [Stylosanthes scabra]
MRGNRGKACINNFENSESDDPAHLVHSSFVLYSARAVLRLRPLLCLRRPPATVLLCLRRGSFLLGRVSRRRSKFIESSPSGNQRTRLRHSSATTPLQATPAPIPSTTSDLAGIWKVLSVRKRARTETEQRLRKNSSTQSRSCADAVLVGRSVAFDDARGR